MLYAYAAVLLCTRVRERDNNTPSCFRCTYVWLLWGKALLLLLLLWLSRLGGGGGAVYAMFLWLVVQSMKMLCSSNRKYIFCVAWWYIYSVVYFYVCLDDLRCSTQSIVPNVRHGRLFFPSVWVVCRWEYIVCWCWCPLSCYDRGFLFVVINTHTHKPPTHPSNCSFVRGSLVSLCGYVRGVPGNIQHVVLRIVPGVLLGVILYTCACL